MSPVRVTYQDWIVTLGRDPALRRYAGPGTMSTGGAFESDRAAEIAEAVGRALESLTEQERLLIIRFYFMGESYEKLSCLSGRAIHKLAAVHHRAVKKLRARLATFVEKRFDVRPTGRPDCIICRSPFRAEIDTLIDQRDRGRSWRTVIKALKKRYSIIIKTPQILIGHEKYH